LQPLRKEKNQQGRNQESGGRFGFSRYSAVKQGEQRKNSKKNGADSRDEGCCGNKNQEDQQYPVKGIAGK
jgi:hypothetical protein